MLEQLHQQLENIQSQLVLRVMNRLDSEAGTEDLFLRWAEAFNTGNPEQLDLWMELQQHIRWPI